MKTLVNCLVFAVATAGSVFAADCEELFRTPPDEFKPMPLWFINGELTSDGIRQQMTQARERAGLLAARVCFPREAPERAIGSDRRAGE